MALGSVMDSLPKMFQLGKMAARNVISRGLSTSQALCRSTRKWGHGWGYRRGPYLSLFSIDHQGDRRYLKAAHERYKRLDWGVYIRPVGGRNKKHWQKTPGRLWYSEQHIFCAPFHNRRFERMFAPQAKLPRHIPDDPYERYHRTSFFKHHYTKLKNAENIKMFGSRINYYPSYKSVLSKHRTRYNLREKIRHEPPDYLSTVSANRGIYDPFFEPEDTPAPNFERPLIRVNRFMRNKRLENIKELERYGEKINVWNPVLKDFFKKF